jgi:hypothetical protein
MRRALTTRRFHMHHNIATQRCSLPSALRTPLPPLSHFSDILYSSWSFRRRPEVSHFLFTPGQHPLPKSLPWPSSTIFAIHPSSIIFPPTSVMLILYLIMPGVAVCQARRGKNAAARDRAGRQWDGPRAPPAGSRRSSSTRPTGPSTVYTDANGGVVAETACMHNRGNTSRASKGDVVDRG